MLWVPALGDLAPRCIGVILSLLLLDLWTRDTVGCEEGNEFLFCESEAQGTESDAEFVVVKVTIAIEIEEGELVIMSVLAIFSVYRVRDGRRRRILQLHPAYSCRDGRVDRVRIEERDLGNVV